ncbi:multicopper oxidase family protein [Wenjunlia tyrosinilytica]|uniref:Multicopper oxidase n=1 Tax=Wenjunlia tyrosinilytica TaxID=1544741 RepID=A0A917ZP24_9ACTN|nr:multicopper oxidase domain-containing protein [Wenjunlia tyrosinilytica]GGO87407.1 multicopper oxidase [Wenjunlia tyrosinilytica]
MPELNRRTLLLLGSAAGLSAMLPTSLVLAPSSRAAAAAPLPGGTLDPTTIPKYTSPLLIPRVMPRGPVPSAPGSGTVDHYTVAVRQFTQQILPAGLPETTVWGYGSPSSPDTFAYPGPTIEAQVMRPVRITWVNDLVDSRGGFLPHLLPVDPTLHWANPAGGDQGRDSRPAFAQTPQAYRGPVPLVTHLHGGHTEQESDGYPEAWYLPAANDIPAGCAAAGTYHEGFRTTFEEKFQQNWAPGTAVCQYGNDQPAATLWFHDHTIGMTRLNVYAGLAGFYNLRSGAHDLPTDVLPTPAPREGDPPGVRYREVPVMIQDRSFNADGSLFYPSGRNFFDGFGGPYIPSSDISPIANPEFYGNTMVVNGRTWPELEVEPRRYRFRFLNAANARFLVLKLAADATAPRPVSPALPFWQIGADGGFLPAPARLDQLLMAPSERADVLVDFTGMTPGTLLHLVNEGPDGAYGGGTPGTDFTPADVATTGQVMRFRVVPLVDEDISTPPDQLKLPSPAKPGTATVTRTLAMYQADSAVLSGVGPRAALLGAVNADGSGGPLEWHHTITETPVRGTVEVWELRNFTEDAHPVHIHQAQFEVLGRRRLSGGDLRPPEAWETGLKDTVIAHPLEATRISLRFDKPGLFVWHCHILEHEDNEMMRPVRVTE